MININKQGISEIVISTIYNRDKTINNYLFEFIDKNEDLIDNKVIKSDLSIYPNRYHRFQITNGVDVVLGNGQGTINIYQTESESITGTTSSLLTTLNYNILSSKTSLPILQLDNANNKLPILK